MHTLRFNLYSTLFLFVALLLIPFTVLGHGSGASYEEVVDGYLIDIGYEPEEIISESSVRFNFSISSEETNEGVEYSDVWLRINKENKTVYAGGVHRPEFGGAGVLYTFPEEGRYEISARFQNSGDNLAEVTFPLNVSSVEGDTSTSTPLIAGLVGLIFGGLLTFILMRRKRI